MGEKRPNSSEMDEKFKPCDTRDEPRKVFIGGLTRNTNIDVMKAYFGYYGNIIDAIVMVDDDGHSRGFGFVTFDNSDSVEKVLQHPVHFLDGKQVDVKRSVPKALRPPPRQLDTSKKVFLGGLPTDMNEADLREFFSIYGKVTDCVIMYDEKTMKSRGFGFIGFEEETIIDKLLKQQHIQIRHKQVEVKLARPRTHPSVFNAAAAIMGYGPGAAGAGASAVPMIGPRMPAGMGGGGGSQQQYGVSGYDYNAGGYGSYGNYGGYNYGNGTTTAAGTAGGTATGANDPPTKRMKGQGGGDRQAQQQQYPQNYPYPQQYNYDPYGNYYGNYGGTAGAGGGQNPYQNYQYPNQYYGGGGDGKDGSAAGSNNQQQNWWAYQQQGYNYAAPNNSSGQHHGQGQAGPSGAQGQSSDNGNMNMFMPAMMMQSMMFMQQAMFQNMMKKDGSDQQAGTSSDPSNASHSMESMRAVMQQKAAEFAKKK